MMPLAKHSQQSSGSIGPPHPHARVSKTAIASRAYDKGEMIPF
jgi:hypothetical protein